MIVWALDENVISLLEKYREREQSKAWQQDEWGGRMRMKMDFGIFYEDQLKGVASHQNGMFATTDPASGLMLGIGGTGSYYQMMRLRPSFWLQLLEDNIDFVNLDSDIVFYVRLLSSVHEYD